MSSKFERIKVCTLYEAIAPDQKDPFFLEEFYYRIIDGVWQTANSSRGTEDLNHKNNYTIVGEWGADELQENVYIIKEDPKKIKIQESLDELREWTARWEDDDRGPPPYTPSEIFERVADILPLIKNADNRNYSADIQLIKEYDRHNN